MHLHLAVGPLPGTTSCGRRATTSQSRSREAGGDRRMAKAPQQLGIGIRRHFTTPDAHPYDTVAWERRDARIPNFKDGGDAFFQPEVEFPTSWSLNATNIV